MAQARKCARRRRAEAPHREEKNALCALSPLFQGAQSPPDSPATALNRSMSERQVRKNHNARSAQFKRMLPDRPYGHRGPAGAVVDCAPTHVSGSKDRSS